MWRVLVFLDEIRALQADGMFSAYAQGMDTIAHGAGERWEFRCDRTAGGWQWSRRARDGGIVASSTRNFPSLNEAVCDALESGFTYTHAARTA